MAAINVSETCTVTEGVLVEFAPDITGVSNVSGHPNDQLLVSESAPAGLQLHCDISTTGTGGWTDNGGVSGSGMTYSHFFTGLTPATTYYFRSYYIIVGGNFDGSALNVYSTIKSLATLNLVEINVSNSITLTESRTVNKTLNVSVSDAISHTEVVGVNPVGISVVAVENLGVFDAVTFTGFNNLSNIAFETLAVSDVAHVVVAKNVHATEFVGVVENVHVLMSFFISVSDSVGVVASPVVAGPVLPCVVSDSVGVVASPVVAGPVLPASVSDAVVVSPVVVLSLLQGVYVVSVSDSVSVVQNVVFSGSSFVSVHESVSVGEVVLGAVGVGRGVSEGVGVEENIRVGISSLSVNSHEAVGVVDFGL